MNPWLTASRVPRLPRAVRRRLRRLARARGGTASLVLVETFAGTHQGRVCAVRILRWYGVRAGNARGLVLNGGFQLHGVLEDLERCRDTPTPERLR